MNYSLIETDQQLSEVMQSINQAQVIALDTEFVRTRTYFAKLGLIQIYDGKQLLLIDPNNIAQKHWIKQLLENPDILKVLHACSEDLEVLHDEFGCYPHPMLDTQQMLAFLGEGLSTGFASAVEEYLAVELDKSESRTDWTARPLTKQQLNYAAADVYYLLPLFHKLSEKLAHTPWQKAAYQEAQLLIEKRSIERPIDHAYLDIKGAWQLSSDQLAVLKVLAMWRKQIAIKKNLALNFVVKESELLTLATTQVTNYSAMEKQGIDKRTVQRYGRVFATLIRQGQQLPIHEQPQPIQRVVDMPGYKQLLKQLKDNVKEVATETGLVVEFIASKKQLHQAINWRVKHQYDPQKQPDVMKYWRQQAIGETLMLTIRQFDMVEHPSG